MTNAAVKTPVSNETTNADVKSEDKKDYQMVAISLPLDLAERLEKDAASSTPKLSSTVFARRIIAEKFSYDIVNFEKSRRRGRAKFATEEEKQNAAKTRTATVKALMEKYEKGEINISDDEIKNAMASMKPRAKKNSK